MHKVKTHSLLALFAAGLVFVAYQNFFGGEKSQAYASLEAGTFQNGVTYNYKPAVKRVLRSRIKSDDGALLAMNGSDIKQIFDTPELVRRDLPTVIWQYRNDGCVLDVYFTAGDNGDVSQSDVIHYEIRNRSGSVDVGANADNTECLHDMVGSTSVFSLLDVNAFYKVSQ